jgi:hypothetical protein
VAVAWTDAEIAQNPNRRGFVRPTPNGHALQYADGTPFFMVGDTWLAASTWRLPWKGSKAAADYIPAPGIGFEEAVAYRKRQGFNSVSFISAFPNWDADHRGATFANADGVYLRNAWEKFGFWAPDAAITTADGATTTAKDMADEQGHRPFAVFADRDGLADFDRLDPAYFRSLDRKLRHLSEKGFVPFVETVRRDAGPSWKAYFDFDRSYARYVQYLIARYGAFNLVFSGIHLDWIPKEYSLTADEFNAALTHHWRTFGTLPFGQPYTTLIDSSTYRRFGHGERAPWLTMHTVGNKPRNNAIYALLEELFRLSPPYPAANLEPYYAGWNHEINRPGGETPAADSDRDGYFARAMMYGSVLSGGLAGHVYGTGAYDVTTTGEPAGWRPYIWEALRYRSGAEMQHLGRFLLSEGGRHQQLELASADLRPRAAGDSMEDGLDGWGFMMRRPTAPSRSSTSRWLPGRRVWPASLRDRATSGAGTTPERASGRESWSWGPTASGCSRRRPFPMVLSERRATGPRRSARFRHRPEGPYFGGRASGLPSHRSSRRSVSHVQPARSACTFSLDFHPKRGIGSAPTSSRDKRGAPGRTDWHGAVGTGGGRPHEERTLRVVGPRRSVGPGGPGTGPTRPGDGRPSRGALQRAGRRGHAPGLPLAVT